MDFFERQERARRRTSWLVALFVFAVVAIVLGVMAGTAALGIWADSGGRDELMSLREWLRLRWSVVALVGLGTLGVIAAGSFAKTIGLRSGGERIATSLGGRLVEPGGDLHQQRLLNVVEEMAIAAGVPCPRVYMLDSEPAINAFAAGFAPEDAVIGVTRGTATELDRDELQGVIAHEFSHILNGDMRLNLRLIGVLNGILLISATGQALARSARHSFRVRSSGKGGSPGALLGAFAVVLLVVGFVGLVAARMIKASVSREREYLADASAVQFTRNPRGIGRALLKLLGLGSRLDAPSEEVSHLLFGAGAGLSWLFATHPPLEDRIRAIDPELLGDAPPARAARPSERGSSDETRAFAELPEAAQPASFGLTPARVVSAAGEIRPVHLERARGRLREIPDWLRREIVFPDSAQAACLALLLSRADERNTQLEAIAAMLGGEARALADRFGRELEGLDPGLRFPAVELALTALRVLPAERRERFLRTARAVAEADDTISVLEWTLLSLLESSLATTDSPGRAERTRLARLQKQAIRLVSIAIELAGAEGESADSAFGAACSELGFETSERPPIEDWHAELSEDLHALRALRPTDKRRVLLAVSAAFLSDRVVTLEEVEILRALGAGLGCPIPPLEPTD